MVDQQILINRLHLSHVSGNTVQHINNDHFRSAIGEYQTPAENDVCTPVNATCDQLDAAREMTRNIRERLF